jgi:hypothetical protein
MKDSRFHVARILGVAFTRGWVIALLFASGISYAQPTRPSPEFTRLLTPVEIAQRGSRVGSEYRNEFLKFSISVPDGWTFASEEMNKRVLAEGKEKIIANETKARQDAIDKSMANTVVLFSMARYPFGDPRNSGNFTSGYERASGTAPAYGRSNLNLLLAKSPGARIVKDIHAVEIGGKQFHAFDLESSPNGVKVMQTYYFIGRSAGVLFFISTWVDGVDDERKALESVVRSLKFDG